MRQRFFGLALIVKNAAQGVVGFGALGVDRDGAAGGALDVIAALLPSARNPMRLAAPGSVCPACRLPARA